MPAKGEGKLRELNKLINQFASSIRHKPFVSDMDKARTLGFIKALRNVITEHGSKPIKRVPIYEAVPWKPLTDEERQNARDEISRVREHLKKGKANELDGQD